MTVAVLQPHPGLSTYTQGDLTGLLPQPCLLLLTPKCHPSITELGALESVVQCSFMGLCILSLCRDPFVPCPPRAAPFHYGGFISLQTPPTLLTASGVAASCFSRHLSCFFSFSPTTVGGEPCYQCISSLSTSAAQRCSPVCGCLRKAATPSAGDSFSVACSFQGQRPHWLREILSWLASVLIPSMAFRASPKMPSGLRRW